MHCTAILSAPAAALRQQQQQQKLCCSKGLRACVETSALLTQPLAAGGVGLVHGQDTTACKEQQQQEEKGGHGHECTVPAAATAKKRLQIA